MTLQTQRSCSPLSPAPILATAGPYPVPISMDQHRPAAPGTKVLYWPTWHDQAIEQALKDTTNKAVALVVEACGLELVVGAPHY